MYCKACWSGDGCGSCGAARRIEKENGEEITMGEVVNSEGGSGGGELDHQGMKENTRVEGEVRAEIQIVEGGMNEEENKKGGEGEESKEAGRNSRSTENQAFGKSPLSIIDATRIEVQKALNNKKQITGNSRCTCSCF